MDKARLTTFYFLPVMSGVISILSFPPFNLSFLIWFGLVPLIYSLIYLKYNKEHDFKEKISASFIIGFLYGFVFYSGTLYWLYNIFGWFFIVFILILSLYPAFFSLLFFYVFYKTKNDYLFVIFSAILWTSIEYIKSETWWLKFSWMNLGYSQYNMLYVLQSANIYGQYGLSFLIVFINSLIAYMLIHMHKKEKVFKSMVLLVIVISSVLFYGYFNIQKEYPADIKVALIQDESSDFYRYSDLMSKINENVNFILLPEYAIPEYLNEDINRMNDIKNITSKYKSYLIIGSKYLISENSKEFYNAAYLFDSDGNVKGKYYKMNPVQFFNDGKPGKEFNVFKTEYGVAGILICYDMDYSYVARNLVRNGAELLFIPTFDAKHWGDIQHKQHSAMTSMRAVENGRFIARATTSGISQIIDPSGRVLNKIDIGKKGISIGSIQALSHKTIYRQYGYTLPYICIMISLLLVLYYVSRDLLSEKKHKFFKGYLQK